MNAIVNHLGFSPIEANGIELEEEIISHHISISYDDVSQIIYTQKFGSTYYDYLICLPIEIKIVDYNVIENSKNLVKHIECMFRAHIADGSRNNPDIRIDSNYLSEVTHKFVCNMKIKITYLVLPEKFQIKPEGTIYCRSNIIYF